MAYLRSCARGSAAAGRLLCQPDVPGRSTRQSPAVRRACMSTARLLPHTRQLTPPELTLASQLMCHTCPRDSASKLLSRSPGSVFLRFAMMCSASSHPRMGPSSTLAKEYAARAYPFLPSLTLHQFPYAVRLWQRAGMGRKASRRILATLALYWTPIPTCGLRLLPYHGALLPPSRAERLLDCAWLASWVAG